MAIESGEITVGKVAGMVGAGLAIVGASFMVGETNHHSAQTNGVEVAANGDNPENLPPLNPVDFVPEVQAAQANQETVNIINGVIAMAFEEQKRQVGEYINAKAAEEAAAREAELEQSRQQVEAIHSSGNPDFLACVRGRESGGNYSIYNYEGSGAAGAYQIMPGTWNNTAAHIGRYDLVGIDPAQASPADQDMMAQALFEWQGMAPWGGGC